MLTDFQREILGLLATNRSDKSFIADGSALNRDFPRLSGDLDVFHRTVAEIDAAFQSDRRLLDGAGYTLSRIRERDTSREWLVAAGDESTKLQWTRDTSWLFFPPVRDEVFGFALSFEDLCVNKLSAASERGRLRDFHDLAALDQIGVRPWVLALAAMGKDAEFSPEMRLQNCLRLLAQAGIDDEDPEYAASEAPPWPDNRRYLDDRFREDLSILTKVALLDWAGKLPLDAGTGRLPLDLAADDLNGCRKHTASRSGVWPTSPAISSQMLRAAQHPGVAERALARLQPKDPGA